MVVQSIPYLLNNEFPDGQPSGSITAARLRDLINAVTFTPASVSAAGTTQGTATQLSATFSIVTSGAANSGVQLAPLVSQLQIIYNATANAIDVWPNTSMAIGGGSVNAAVSLAAASVMGIVVASATQAWIVFGGTGGQTQSSITISGVSQVGQTLTVPAVSNATYEWLRRGAPIPGATSNTYTLTPLDYGAAPTAVINLPAESNIVSPASTVTSLPTLSSNPVGVWGLAPMVAGYNGACLNVRRASDNSTLDIGFSGGSIDYTSAVNFQSTSTLYVTKVYDQTGNGNHLTQSAATNQPILYLSSPGGPCIMIQNDGTNGAGMMQLSIPTTAQANRTSCSFFMACRMVHQAVTGGYFLMGTSNSTADIGLRGFVSKISIQPYTAAAYDANTIENVSDNTGIMVDTCSNEIVGVCSGAGGITIHRDNHTATAPAISVSGTMTSGGLVGTLAASSQNTDMDFFGFMMYPTSLSNTDATNLKTALRTIFNTNPINPPINILFQGDSKTYAADNVNNEILTRMIQYYLPAGTQVRNSGISGHAIVSDATSSAPVASNWSEPTATHNVAVLYEGVNDFAIYGYTAQQVWAAVQSWVATQVANGFDTFVMLTLTVVNYQSANEATPRENNRQLYNSYIRQNLGNLFDAFADVEQIPGFVLNSLNVLSFFPDGIHENTGAYTLEAPVVAAAVQKAIAAPKYPQCTAFPVMSGTPVVGNTLTCTTGTWTRSPTSYSYSWTSNGFFISGATSSSYVLQTSDRGNVVLCSVLATNANGAAGWPVAASSIGVTS